MLILDLLLAKRFPKIWVPTPAERDLRQLVWHRHELDCMRTMLGNQLHALALSQGAVLQEVAIHQPCKPPCPTRVRASSEGGRDGEKARNLSYLVVLRSRRNFYLKGKLFGLAVHGELGRCETLRGFFRGLVSGGFPTDPTATLGSKNLAASKCRDLENRLEAEGRSFVRLLRTRFTRFARRIHVHHVRHVLHVAYGPSS